MLVTVEMRRLRVAQVERIECEPLPTRPSMCASTAPDDGDIVVRQETREGRDVYVLHTATGVDQYLLRTREEAVRQAVTFAKRQGVRAWLAGKTHDVVLLNDVRVVESV